MASGDGLILRVKPRGSRLGLAQASRIADVSRRFGNGALDLTSRANIQVRGIDEARFDTAIDALGEVGLIDRSAAAEAVRNVVVSPLAGHDPSVALDIREVVAALEARLESDASLHALPAKFSVVVDDGGAYGLDNVTADIRFRAVCDHSGPVFAIRLADDPVEDLCFPADLPEAFAALARAFMAARAADPALHRMRHLVARDGGAAVFGRAGLSFSPCRRRWRPLASLRGQPTLGCGAPDEGSKPFAGNSSSGAASAVPPSPARGEGRRSPRLAHLLRVSAPFGRISADQFSALIDATARAGGTELRLTPWRAILVPELTPDAILRAEAACVAVGLIVDDADPRLSVAACPGAPGCHRGTTPVLDHAARLSHRLRALLGHGEIALHVSGCGKGCAHAGKVPLTLVGHDGRYDIVVDGTAADLASVKNLSFEEAARCIATSFRESRL